MQLSQNSRIVRWAYLFSSFGPPGHVSLCVLFWRSVLLTPMIVLSLLVLVVGFSFMLYENFLPLTLIVVAGSLITTICIGIWLATQAVSRTAIGHMIKTKKSKICPIIDLT